MDGSSGTILTSELAGKIAALKDAELSDLPPLSVRCLDYTGLGFSGSPIFVGYGTRSDSKATGNGYYSDGSYGTSVLYNNKTEWSTIYGYADGRTMTVTLFEGIGPCRVGAVKNKTHSADNQVGYSPDFSNGCVIRGIVGLPYKSAATGLYDRNYPVVVAGDGDTNLYYLNWYYPIIVIPQSKVITLHRTPINYRGFIFVNDSYVDQYKSATNWTLIKDRIYPMSSYPNWVNDRS